MTIRSGFVCASFLFSSFIPLFASVAVAESAEAEYEHYIDLELEDLLDVTLISASKTEEKVEDTATAAFVISGDKIRRTGATNIVDALRLVPGVTVSQVFSNQWAVSSRGFHQDFANKLLVLVDGRSIYSPLFSGVFWDRHPVFLQDIERIEVIRGPGASLWGANAVNGVINIITRQAEDTQGGFVSVMGGSPTEQAVAFRYGGQSQGNNAIHYRVYAEGAEREQLQSVVDSASLDDQWNTQDVGFRMDWRQGADRAEVQGQVSSVRINEDAQNLNGSRQNAKGDIDSYHLQGRWQGKRDLGTWSVRSYFDSERQDSGTLFFEDVKTVDVDVQLEQACGGVEWLWGLGYRNQDIKTKTGDRVAFDPASQNVELISGFVQASRYWDERRFKLTLGSKFENHEFTGTEIQPTLRFRWRSESDSVWWGAISRAVRTPSLVEHDLDLRVQAFGLVIDVVGNPEVKSETLLAYELGYRKRIGHRISLDIATFYNVYDNLVGATGTLLSQSFENLGEGVVKGFELASEFRVNDWWRMNLALSRTDSDINFDAAVVEWNSQMPDRQLTLTAHFSPFSAWEFDVSLFYVGDTLFSNGLTTNNSPVDDYLRTDLIVRYHWQHNAVVSVIGSNLFDGQHQEAFTTDTRRFPPGGMVERGLLVKVDYEF